MSDLTQPPLATEPTADTINVLGKLDTLEVTLVRRGANGRPLALRKSAPAKVTKMPDPTKPAEGAAPAAPAAPAGETPKVDTSAAAPAKADFVMPARNDGESDADYVVRCAMALKACEMPADAAPAKGSPDGADVHVPTTELQKSVDAMPASVRKAYNDAVAKAATLEAEIAKAKRAETRRIFVGKAAEFSNLGTAEAIGELLHDVTEVAPKIAVKIEGLLKSAQVKLAKSALFVEFGKGASETDTAGDNPGARLDALSKALAEKEKISFAKAQAKVLATTEGRELYAKQEALSK